MKIEKFKELEKKINGQNFNQSYKTINIVLTVLSYFGHIASIFLAYFMLSKVIEGAMTGNIVVAGIASVILLGGLELLKRDMFDKFSISFLKLKGITKEVLPLFFISLAIICISFYASIKGASEFSSKSAEIEVKGKETIKTYNDSLTKVYGDEIKGLEDSFKSKDETLTNLQNLALTQRLSKDQRTTITDLSTQKKDIQQQVADKKIELANKIKEHETGVTTEAAGKKEDNSKNSLIFVIISTLIELTILAGVFFNEYYKFRSYNEFRDKIEKDPNYQKWLLYEEMLQVIFTEDTKVNQKLPSNKAIIDMCKANSLFILPRDIIDFIRLLNSINIIRTSGSAKYFGKQREVAFETLRRHFNIE
jgi:CII-binding regulator of phage lambda lysogenization HflD